MDDLDDLFATARRAAPVPSADLLARVMADAAALQPAPRPLVRVAPAAARPGFWAALSGLFGGGGVLAGMGTAAVAGVFLGFAQPAPVAALTEVLGGTAAMDFAPGIDALLTEE